MKKGAKLAYAGVIYNPSWMYL